MRRALLLAVVLALGACATSTEEVERAATASGFADVRPGGTEWFACGRGDKDRGRRFVATNARGERVSGVVCCGYFFKGCTVRF